MAMEKMLTVRSEEWRRRGPVPGWDGMGLSSHRRGCRHRHRRCVVVVALVGRAGKEGSQAVASNRTTPRSILILKRSPESVLLDLTMSW